MASFESLSDADLRKKLLEYGYDVPVALNRDFLISKLEKVTSNKPSERSKSARKSTPPVLPSRPPTTNSSTKNSRLSLNETGLRQRQGSREPEFGSLSTGSSSSSRGRKSLGSAVNASPAKSTHSTTSTETTRSSGSTITTSSRRSLQRQNVYFLDQQEHPTGGRLNPLVEERHAQEEEEVEDEYDEDDDDEEEEDEDDDDDMDVDEDEGVEEDMPVQSTMNRPNTTASSSSFNFGSPMSTLTSASSYLTRRTRASESAASPTSPSRGSRAGAGAGGDSSSSSNSRFQSYLNYFKGDLRSEPQMPRGFISPSTTSPGSYFYSSTPGTPYSTTATAGSPSYRSYGEISGDESDEEEGEIRDGRMRKALKNVNPVNWIPKNVKSWFSSSNAGSPTGERQTESHGYTRATSNSNYSTAPSTPVSSYSAGRYSSSSSTTTGLNGHWGPASASLANRLYSPATPPPPVPPAMAAGRQAGFKAFFSRGERNGYGYGGNNTTGGGTTDWASSSHLISKILVFVFILAFLALGGVYYYKSTLIAPENGIAVINESGSTVKYEKSETTPAPPASTNKRLITSLNYPICGLDGVDQEACVSKDMIKNSTKLFKALKEELMERGKNKGCRDGAEDQISLQSAKNLLYRLVDLKKTEVDDAFEGLLLLVTENPSCGIKIEPKSIPSDEDVSSRDIRTLDYNVATITAVGISPSFICTIIAGFYSLIMYFVFFTMLSILGYGGYKGIVYWQGRKMREEVEMFDLIERILELLNQRYEQSKSQEGIDSFIALNHVRDELFSPRDRKKKEALWNKVVQHISTSESRVREEIQHISGEEFRVWRWLPSASPLASKKFAGAPNSQVRKSSRHSLPPAQSSSGGGGASASPSSGLYPNLGAMELDGSGAGSSPNSLNNKWQGQAFEMFDGSPNALPIIPTTCLKIRQMFDTERDSGEPAGHRIERAILEKCSNSKILHIGIENGSTDGCVYVRCLTKDDARDAYSSLHGWWFDGHLLSVKFLREERYFARFPEAKARTIPLTQAFLNQSHQLSSQQIYSNTMNIRSGGTTTTTAGSGAGAGSARVRYTMGY